MLSNLYIENIAVIEKTSIDFKKGLNVMTGETGAGKSIVIDSLNVDNVFFPSKLCEYFSFNKIVL